MTPFARSTIAAAALLLLAAAKPPEESVIRYKITPGFWFDGVEAFRVDMRFRGDADGETVLELPGEWAGSTELWRNVRGLEIRGARRLEGYYDRPVIRHAPGARIKVSYHVVSAYRDDPGFAYEKARPIVRADWFFFHGEGVFAVPGGRQGAPARFSWRKLPRGWAVASDLDHLAGTETTVANMVDSVAIGGRGLKVVHRDIGGAPLRLATLGKWSFEAEQLADVVAPIIAAEDAFWGDRSSPFLVAMAPLGTLPSGLSYTGTGRADAFSIASTSAFELKHATRFLAHEYMHGWVPHALGAMPAQNEAADYWFSEGFNDYLAAKVLLRSGIWSTADYVADKNETLLRYGTSPAKRATAADVAARFWRDQAVQQVSYDRGHILATILDAEIARKSGGAKSLDQVLKAQRLASVGNEALATDLFRTTLLAETGIDPAPLIERHARNGEPLAIPDDLFEGCARVVTERLPGFDRGYDAEATRLAGGVIKGVAPDGPAHAAGMRDGMRLVRREEGKIGDASVEIAYRVADEAGERVLRYLPRGRETFEVQRLELQGDGGDPACAGGAAAAR